MYVAISIALKRQPISAVQLFRVHAFTIAVELPECLAETVSQSVVVVVVMVVVVAGGRCCEDDSRGCRGWRGGPSLIESCLNKAPGSSVPHAIHRGPRADRQGLGRGSAGVNTLRTRIGGSSA